MIFTLTTMYCLIRVLLPILKNNISRQRLYTQKQSESSGLN